MRMLEMRGMIRKMFGGGTPLSALEELVLGCVRACLSEPIGELWDRQIEAINKVQRLPDGVEVNFYRMKSGRPTFDRDLAFPNKDEELHVAIVHLKIPNVVALIADVWCVNGFLFSIEYKGKLKLFCETTNFHHEYSVISDCNILADLATDVVR